jgi:hypothetical protein
MLLPMQNYGLGDDATIKTEGNDRAFVLAPAANGEIHSFFPRARMQCL